jgi:hypothetical protein
LREPPTGGLETVLQGSVRVNRSFFYPIAANLRRMSIEFMSRPDGRAVAGAAV